MMTSPSSGQVLHQTDKNKNLRVNSRADKRNKKTTETPRLKVSKIYDSYTVRWLISMIHKWWRHNWWVTTVWIQNPKCSTVQHVVTLTATKYIYNVQNSKSCVCSLPPSKYLLNELNALSRNWNVWPVPKLTWLKNDLTQNWPGLKLTCPKTDLTQNRSEPK